MGPDAHSSEQWFSNYPPQNLLDSLLEHRLLGPTPRISHSVDQGWGPRICISESSAPTPGSYFKEHWVKGDNYRSSIGKKICVCVLRVCVCVAPPLPSSPASCPSFIQLSGPFSGSVVQTQGFASGRSGPGSPRARAHPHSHSCAGSAHTQPPQCRAPRFHGIPGMLRGFLKSPRQGNKERSFSNHFLSFFF